MKQIGLIAAALLAINAPMNVPTVCAADLSLAEAINVALENNTPQKITDRGKDTANYALRRAKGAKGISVAANDSLSTSKSKNSQRQDGNALGLTGSLPVYSGGKNTANVDSAKIGVDIAELTAERARENLKYSVIKAYYDVLEAKKTVAVNEETVANYSAHYQNVSALFAAGAKAKIDVLRSSVELSNARQNLIKSQNTYDVNVATLCNVVNIPRGEPLNLTDDFSFVEFVPGMEDCITYALNNRKDLTIDEYSIKQKDLAVTVAKAGWLPSINLNMGINESDEFHPASGNNHNAQASVGVQWNVFDSGVTRATVDSAKNDREIAILTLQKDKEDIELAVRKAYLNMREAQKRFDSTADAVTEAEEDFFIAREKYRAGEGIMLDIIDAQLALSTAKLNYISAQYDYARYKAELENAMGQPL